jgi:hypothetical protein
MKRALILPAIVSMIGVPWFIYWYNYAPRLHSETQAYSLAQLRAGGRYADWCNLADKLIPQMCTYYERHPERFKRAGADEEIEIDGFASFVPSSLVRWGRIVDPWGEPVHFVQDLNRDGFVEARGQRRDVLRVAMIGKPNVTNEEHRFGIAKHSLKGIENRPHDTLFAVTWHEYRYE